MALTVPEFLQTQTYSAIRVRETFKHAGVQHGVWGATDLKPTQRAAGANMSVDIDDGWAAVLATSAGNSGLYHVQNTADNVEIGTANPTNPRVDQVVARVYDSTHGTDLADEAELLVLPGTPAVGATLANRTGAAALPVNALRLADVLVGAGVTQIVTADIRDRRPWMRGAFAIKYVTDTVDIASSTSTPAQMGGGRFLLNVETTGVPLRITCEVGITWAGASGSTVALSPRIDGASVFNGTSGEQYFMRRDVRGSGTLEHYHATWTILDLPAGWHTFDMNWNRVSGVSANMGLPFLSSGTAGTMLVEELLPFGTNA